RFGLLSFYGSVATNPGVKVTAVNQRSLQHFYVMIEIQLAQQYRRLAQFLLEEPHVVEQKIPSYAEQFLVRPRPGERFKITAQLLPFRSLHSFILNLTLRTCIQGITFRHLLRCAARSKNHQQCDQSICANGSHSILFVLLFLLRTLTFVRAGCSLFPLHAFGFFYSFS